MKQIAYNIKNRTKISKEVIETLACGGLVISPSDTVYGLLVDATNEKAVEKLIQFKNRPPGKAISIFVSDISELQSQVTVDKQQLGLVKELLPGPFTVILASKSKVSPLLESEKRTLGVRIPNYQFLLELVKKFGKPVTATSANLSGRPPHYSISSFLNDIPDTKKNLIDLIIDAGTLPRNKPSTVVDLTNPQIKIVRRGDIVFTDRETYISASPSGTRKIAKYILKKVLKNKAKKPLIFILEGDLGVGKTVFVQGMGEFLGIKNIISPTFVVYYEYVSINRLIDTFVHIDLYNIQETEEFKYLGIEKYLKNKNLLCFEWGEKAGEIINLLKQKGIVVYVRMNYINEMKRKLQFNFLNFNIEN